MPENVITETEFTDLKFLKRGKVRDMYEVGENILIVSTDRISAFDVILTQGIPRKGEVLTQISKYWFDLTDDIIPNHIVTIDVEEFPEECSPYKEELRGRSMLVKKAQPLLVECIVRGYITGSGWKEYQESGTVCGISLPEGLVESAMLPETIFTPSTKAEQGDHDENITFDQAVKIIGSDLAQRVRDKSIAIYERARELAAERGIIIADTKMEFGSTDDGELILIDELLTPDSSRFWPSDKYQPGRGQESYDKQYVRDYLISIDFNKKPPAPPLPEEVIRTTSEKYLEALNSLTANGR